MPSQKNLLAYKLMNRRLKIKKLGLSVKKGNSPVPMSEREIKQSVLSDQTVLDILQLKPEEVRRDLRSFESETRLQNLSVDTVIPTSIAINKANLSDAMVKAEQFIAKSVIGKGIKSHDRIAKLTKVAILSASNAKKQDYEKAGLNYKGLAADQKMLASEGITAETRLILSTKAADLAAGRAQLAAKAIYVLNNKADDLVNRDGADISLKEATFMLKTLETTEHSGKKYSAPEVKVSIQHNTQNVISASLEGINKILGRSKNKIDTLEYLEGCD